jgi:hypothetical protein
VTQLDKLTVQAVSARAGLVTEMQPTSVDTQPIRQLPDMIGPMRDRSPMANLAITPTPRNRD